MENRILSMKPFKWWILDAPRVIKKRCKVLLHRFEDGSGDGGLTINPYVGCAHRCVYCYATYDWAPNFYDVIEAKVNAGEVLSSEITKLGARSSGPVFISSATDCYQPVEGKYKLTRRCIEILQRRGIPYCILTKSSSIVRDLHLHASYKDKCLIAWSLTTLDEGVKGMIEPKASPASSILKAIKLFSSHGVRVGVNIDPIIPGLTDDPYMLQRLVEEVARAGAKYASAAILRLRDDIWARLRELLNSRDLDSAIKKIEYLYFKRGSREGYYYVVDKNYASQVLRYVEGLVRDNGMVFGFPIEELQRPCYVESRSGGAFSGKQLTLSSIL